MTESNTTQTLLPCEIVEFNPKNKPINKAIIWLHGLGASGHDFVPVVSELGLDSEQAIRFVFPHAPRMPVTVNGGYIMPAWYDIYEMTLERKIDVAQIDKSSELINNLIDHQIALGVPSENIIIAGFSQGGAVAYHNVLGNQRKLAGLMALSTYFATDALLTSIPTNTNIPVAIYHGEFDNVVPRELGERAKSKLSQLGLTPIYKTYPMAHQVCGEQISDMGAWISSVFDKD